MIGITIVSTIGIKVDVDGEGEIAIGVGGIPTYSYGLPHKTCFAARRVKDFHGGRAALFNNCKMSSSVDIVLRPVTLCSDFDYQLDLFSLFSVCPIIIKLDFKRKLCRSSSGDVTNYRVINKVVYILGPFNYAHV
ncbi:hypothetical protein ES703_88084 [subsurface metagenome]